MFDRFFDAFDVARPGRPCGPPWEEPRLLSANGYLELAQRIGGCAVAGGLYRFHDAQTGPRALGAVTSAFPGFAERAVPSGYDWLGRQFALDVARREKGEMLVLLMEPGTGQVLEIPMSIIAFHEQELVDQQDAALASTLFAEWASRHPGRLPLAADQYVGYRVPLFLGGQDTIENLELIDLDVYWSLCGKLHQGVSQLPRGASIRQLSISKTDRSLSL